MCLAHLATELAEATGKEPAYLPLATYSEYALAMQLTEALRQDPVMPLKPAGGRSVESWQLELSGRLAELKKVLQGP